MKLQVSIDVEELAGLVGQQYHFCENFSVAPMHQ